MGRIFIPRTRESHGIQIVGASGTHKTSAIVGIVEQAIARGYSCVFTDIGRQYLTAFFRPSIDALVDIEDKRCCRVMLGKEARNELEAMPIAEGVFPDEPNRQFFFQDHARGILAYLLGGNHPQREKVSTSWLAHVFAHEKLINWLVKGTEHAITLSPSSPDQFNGILGTLNHFGRTLRWLPDEEGMQELCIREWAQSKKQQHIFLSSTPVSFSAQKILHSTIFDLILLNVQKYRKPCLIVADEIGEFQRSPQLEKQCATGRKSGVVLIMAYQGYVQLKEHYGANMAESISLNPYTNLVFRTGSESAQHASALLGLDAEIERVRETRAKFSFLRGNLIEEYARRAPVSAGEIQDLEDGFGYVAQAGKITKVYIPWRPVKEVQPSLLERDFDAAAKREMRKDLLRAEEEEKLRARARARGYDLVPIPVENPPYAVDQPEPAPAQQKIRRPKQVERTTSYRARYN
jgi:hypothetical protein